MNVRGPDEPMPKRDYCCGHAYSCAIHQPPFDTKVVRCTCGSNYLLWRHQRFIVEPATEAEAQGGAITRLNP
jgi:hypothetical protein